MKTTVSKNNTNDNKIQEYWTKERRDNAEALELPYLPDYGQHESYPDTSTPIKTTVIPPNSSIHDLKKGLEYSTHAAIPVSDPTKHPWVSNGKLFFTHKGKDYTGSAGSIFNEILLTAGHNIFDEGEWSDNFMYYPAYPNISKGWSWSRAAIFTSWKNNQNFAFDYGMILLDQPLPKEIGSLGCLLDLSPEGRTWTALGYPGAPYSGNQMYKTTGRYVHGKSIITMDNNDMTKGSSGGSWLIQTSDGPYINGVQSTRGKNKLGVDVANYAASPFLSARPFHKLLDCVGKNICE